MGSVDFSAYDISSFCFSVDDVIYRLKTELENAAAAKNACTGIVNDLSYRADRCLSSINSDLDLVNIVWSRNRSKLDSLQSKLSSLGTGEENASARSQVKSQIEAIESKNSALSNLEGRLYRMQSTIEDTVNKFQRYLYKVEKEYEVLAKLYTIAEKELAKIKYEAKKAEELAISIVNALSFNATIRYPEQERITLSYVGAMDRFADELSSKKVSMIRKKKEIVEEAYVLRQSLTDEISAMATETVSDMSSIDEEFNEFLDKAHAAFSRASNMLHAYEQIGE